MSQRDDQTPVAASALPRVDEIRQRLGDSSGGDHTRDAAGGRVAAYAPRVAALFVQTDGVYFGLDGVDPWDEKRDARLYAGPHPVVAHPPCNVWGQLAPVNEARYGKPVGHDGGSFAAALEAVEAFGGVLEHPAYTLAWHAFDLDRPRRDSWQPSRRGWVTEVSQSAYGHKARKRTWLYYVGDTEPPALDWRDVKGEAVIGGGINSGECQGRPKIEKREASRTPEAFRDLLLDLARNSRTVARVAA